MAGGCCGVCVHVIGSQNSLCRKEPLKVISFKPPAITRDIFSCIRLLRAPSSLTLNVSRDGAYVPVFHHPHCKKFLPQI